MYGTGNSPPQGSNIASNVSYQDLSYEDQTNQKELSKFQYDEQFINQMLEKYTQLESKFYELIVIH